MMMCFGVRIKKDIFYAFNRATATRIRNESSGAFFNSLSLSLSVCVCVCLYMSVLFSFAAGEFYI